MITDRLHQTAMQLAWDALTWQAREALTQRARGVLRRADKELLPSDADADRLADLVEGKS